MVLIIKNNAEVMNERCTADWSPRQAKLNKLLDIQKKERTRMVKPLRQQLNKHIAAFENEKIRWEQRLIRGVIDTYGGVFGDYSIYQVPVGDIDKAMGSLWIDWDPDKECPIYHLGNRYDIEGSTLTINPQWVQGNYRLTEADTTDFGELDDTESVYFLLAAYRRGQEVSIELFLRRVDEDFGDNDLSPKLLCGVICSGIVYPDKTIEVIERS